MPDVDDAGSETPKGVPPPLGKLINKMDLAVVALAGEDGGREALHLLRNTLSDVAVLTEVDSKIERAIDRVVKAGDRLAEVAVDARLQDQSSERSTRLAIARRALAALDGTLAGARPSRIAMSLDRGW